MAAIPVQISGVLFDKKNKTAQNVHLVGFASIAGLKVDGGPILPEGPPLEIWGDIGDYIDAGFPAPQPPTTPPGQKPVEWHAVWSEETGWVVVGTPTGEHATPSARGARQA